MKITFIYLKSGTTAWADSATQVYCKKLKGFCQFELKELKSKSISRDQKQQKIKKEEDQLLACFEPNAYVVLFDEKGANFNSSVQFSKKLVQILESGRAKLYFVIGGAYGFSDEVRLRANETWSLSHLTMNHQLALVVALEQVYRAFTIYKGIPYHNE